MEKSDVKKIVIVAAELVLVAAAVWVIVSGLMAMGLAEDEYRSQAWVMCRPGDFVNVRAKPGTKAEVIGRFDCGDAFMTDWETRDGWIHAVELGLEETEGWIHLGYVSAWEPEWRNGEEAKVTGKGRVAVRRYCGGPRTGWLKPGAVVQVFYRTEEWCVTNRGYIRTEFLE